ncbi:MAG: OmpA family protein [Pedobacter sp.]|uniref:OmpA family protein n=1 Tax=Pedobacter sp. TaxID=1411316 RepID=UPI0033999F42
MKPLNILLLLCLFGFVVKAQTAYTSNNKKIADLYFKNKEFYAAAEYYKRALQISKDTIGFVVPYAFENKLKEESPKLAEYEYCVFQLATSLRLYKDFRAAEAWYALAKNFPEPKYVLSSFYYGECLRANQKFTEAIPAFKDFLEKYKTADEYTSKAKIEVASCNFALYEMRYPRLYKFSKLFNQINDKGSNYTPLQLNNNFYFTSSRPVSIGKGGKDEVLEDKQTKSKVVKKETPYINAIYEASGDPLAAATSVKRIGAVETGKEFAAPAFHPNGRIMYLTSWTAKGNRKIYEVNISHGNGATWSAPKELGAEVNIIGFNSMQPFITKDGKYLVFSSDRPGGIGKYDLWYCILRADGTLGQAINMGNTINTKEDEEAPYYNFKTKKLLYSSAGKIGIGGLDFYESEGDFASWTEPRNLGYPFNSSKDDAYFTPLNDADTEGYISSDRESVCCLEIFHVRKEFITVQGTVVDCQTEKPLSGAVVTLSDSSQEMRMTVGRDGRYVFRINSNRALKITAEKQDYLKKMLSYNYDELAKADTMVNPKLCLKAFAINVPIVLKDILYDFNSAELNPGSEKQLDVLYTLLMDNPTMEIELSAHTDNVGSKNYNLSLSDKRAHSCVNYLITKGIAAERLKSKGYGFSKPIAPNQFPNGKDNFLGRQQNRRTEFKITKI